MALNDGQPARKSRVDFPTPKMDFVMEWSGLWRGYLYCAGLLAGIPT